MKTFATFAVAVVLGLGLAFVTEVSPAAAAGKYQGTLTGLDAGTTNTVCLTGGNTQNATVRLVCDIPACYKTGTSSPLTANCAQDDVIITPPVGVNKGAVPTFYVPPFDVQMSNEKCVAARAFDGGDPNCRVELMTQNLNGR